MCIFFKRDSLRFLHVAGDAFLSCGGLQVFQELTSLDLLDVDVKHMKNMIDSLQALPHLKKLRLTLRGYKGRDFDQITRDICKLEKDDCLKSVKELDILYHHSQQEHLLVLNMLQCALLDLKN